MKQQSFFHILHAAMAVMLLCAMLMTAAMAEGENDPLFPEAVVLEASNSMELEFDRDNICMLKFRVP